MRVLIAAGGTGGHISPGIALAEEMEGRKKELGIDEIYFHVPERNRSYPDFSRFHWSILWHNLPQFSKNIPVYLVRFLAALIQGILKLKARNIDIVIAMGGYSSVPAILYAILYRKKFFLCEQNVIPGKVNRYFQGKAGKIALHLPVPEGMLDSTKTRITGNPLRKAVIARAVSRPKTVKSKKTGILVMGGSQGARQINNMVLAAFSDKLIADNFRLTIITGANLYDEVKGKVKDKNITLVPYTDRIADYLADNDLLVARSGAGVVAEAAVMAIPAVYIPYPFAADNHQKYNARYFGENGACWLIEHNSENPDELVAILKEIIADKKVLKDKSKAQLALAIKKSSRLTVDFFFGVDSK